MKIIVWGIKKICKEILYIPQAFPVEILEKRIRFD
jgi:hypothetical protein